MWVNILRKASWSSWESWVMSAEITLGMYSRDVEWVSVGWCWRLYAHAHRPTPLFLFLCTSLTPFLASHLSPSTPLLSRAGSDTRREELRHPRSQSLILKQLQWNMVCVSHLHHLSIVLSWSNTELHIICHRMDFPLIYFTMWHNVT